MNTEHLGLQDYLACQTAMQQFTLRRTVSTPDTLWLCEHPPVITLGVAGKTEHVLHTNTLPTVRSDRGGQATYHGPGQVVAYPLIDLHRLGIFVKEYVYRLEEAAIRSLAYWGLVGHRVAGAPGIYVRLDDPFGHSVLTKGDPKAPNFEGLGKIAALGIKVSRGCTYHGISVNVAMDLTAYSAINPCGYAQLRSIDLVGCGIAISTTEFEQVLAQHIAARFLPTN